MKPSPWVFIACTLPFATLACSPEDPTIVYKYDAYQGDAFPNRRPPLIIPETGVLFITNSYSDTVSVLDAVNGDTLGTYPVGRDPVSLDGPHHVIPSKTGDAVYVALSYPTENTGEGPHAAHGASIKSGYAQKLDMRDFSILGQVRVDNNPGEIVLAGDGQRVFTSHFDLVRAQKNPNDIEAARSTIAVIDTSAIALIDSPPPKRIPTCVAPHGMALSSPDGARAYVACYGEDVVAIVDVNAGTVDRVPLAAGVSGFGNPQYGPYSAAMSPNGDKIAFGNTVSKDVRFLDTTTGQIMSTMTIPTFGAPYFPAWSSDGKLLVLPMQAPDAVALIDVETKMELVYRSFTKDECQLPHVATRMEDGSYTLVCEGDHTGPGRVVWLDGTTLATLHSTDVEVYPDALAFYKKGMP